MYTQFLLTQYLLYIFMGLFVKKKTIFLLCVVMQICCTGFAGETLFHQARQLQRSGNYDKSINLFVEFLTQNIDDNNLKDDEITLYSEAIMQLMNTFQSKGEPEECVATLKSVYSASPVIQKYCQRDYYSVLGYALSRTENMEEAEKTAFLQAFEEVLPDRYLVGFCVMGGMFGEGIDLRDDRLIGTFVVGTGIPPVDSRREFLRDYFSKKGRDGYDFAYRFPGMNKVLQAAGRVIRTETDRGIVLLMDERFEERANRELFPVEWGCPPAMDSESAARDVRLFWEEQQQTESI